MNKYVLEHVTTGDPGYDRGRGAGGLPPSLRTFITRPSTSRQSSAAPKPPVSSRCVFSTIFYNPTSPSFRKTCTPFRAAISAASCAVSAGPACRAKTRSSSTRVGSGKSETYIKLAAFYLYLHRIRRRVEGDPSPYTDRALAPADSDASTPFAPRRHKQVTAEQSPDNVAAERSAGSELCHACIEWDWTGHGQNDDLDQSPLSIQIADSSSVVL